MSLSFPNLYLYKNKSESPLFVFIQSKCYELYNSDYYTKGNENPLERMGEFFKSSGNKLKDFLPWSGAKIQSQHTELIKPVKEAV